MATISDKQRDHVLDLHAMGNSRNSIAKAVGISPTSVTTICTAAGLTFDRAATQKATQAAQIDAKKLRQEIADGSLKVAQKAAERIQGMLDRGDDISTKDLITIFGVFVDKNLAISKHDTGGDTTATDSVVDQLLEGFRRQTQNGETRVSSDHEHS